MAKDVRITPAGGKIEFKDTNVLKGTIYESGGNVHINPVGTVVLGDGTPANVQIGAAATQVSFSFLGGGELTAEGNTLFIGTSGDTINLNRAGVTYNLPTNINAYTLQGNLPSAFAAASHTHTIANVSGLQTALDGKQPTGSYLTSVPNLDASIVTTGTFADARIASATNWNSAYNNYITGIAVSGTSTKTITLTQRDGGTITTTFTDIDTNTTYANATTTVSGLMSSTDKTKLDGIATGANNYSHPTGDGNLHVPATGTTNNGKVLTAGSTAGSLSWQSNIAGNAANVTGTVAIANGGTGATTAAAARTNLGLGTAATSNTGDFLAAGGTAVDSSKLGGVAASSYALLASPALTGTPTAPTAATATNNTQIATTAFVKAQGYLTSVTNISGYAGTLDREDNRTISPSELTAGRLKFGFTSWTNNNAAPYADFLHLRSYTDASGGLDNLVMFRKDAIGMRIWQQTWGSTTAYSSYKDVAFTDSNITGNAANVTGTVAIANGGTGATTASAARTNLGLGTAATSNTADFLAAGGTAVDSNKLGGIAAASYALLASPALTGTPTAPTAATATNTTQIATTAFVKAQGYTSNAGTVTSVGGTGSYGGLTLTGTVTSSGNLTLGGTPTGTWPISVSGSAASATTANRLDTYGTISSQNWNTYYVNNKLIAGVFDNATGTNKPPTYNYGAYLSYGNASGVSWQMAIPENQVNSASGARAMHYRSAWNSTWGSWRRILDFSNDTCEISGETNPTLIVKCGVGYNADFSTKLELHGQVDDWAFGKFRFNVTPEGGQQPVYGAEFRIERYQQNASEWFLVGKIPRNTENLEWQGDIMMGLSDQRVKENIEPLVDGIKKVNSINAVEFDWKPVENISQRDGHDIGFIAQQLELVVPEAVYTRGDGYKTVRYEKITPILVQAIKEQQEIIEQLKSRIEKLELK